MEKVFAKPGIGFKNKMGLSSKEIPAVVMTLFGFFVGRVWIFDFFNPIAIAYLSVYLFRGYRYYVTAFFVGLGVLSVFKDVHLVKYLFAIFFMTVANGIISKQKGKKTIFYAASVGAGAIVLAGGLVFVLDHFNWYYLVIALMEGIFTFSLTYLLKTGVGICEGNVQKRVFDSEEIVSISILLGAIIAGASDVMIADISLRNYLCGVVILVMGYKGGAAFGSLSGVLLALILLVTGYGNINDITIFSVSGLASGIYHNKNKFLTALFYVLAQTIITYAINTNGLVPELYMSAIASAITFLLIQEKYYIYFTGNFATEMTQESDYLSKIKQVTVNKLEKFSKSFFKLSTTFEELSEKKTMLDQKDLADLIDDIAAKVCTSCRLNQHCWKENFYDTYQGVFNIIGACEKKGSLEVEDIPNDFFNRCIQLSFFVETAVQHFERHRLNRQWHNKIIESRELIAQQLLGVSGIIQDLTNEIDFHMTFDEKMEEKIIMELHLNQIEAKNVMVLNNKNNKIEITLYFEDCIGKNKCTKEILPMVSRVVGKKMKREEMDCNECKVRLIEEPKFRLTTAVARGVKEKSTESGDSYSILELQNNQMLLALSDGMGSGLKAREESAAAIELLEEFIESGFQKDLAIKIINSILVLKSSEDRFSTLDIFTIDTYSGMAEIVKIGASATFLLREGEVQVIQSTTLPMGILNDVDIEITPKKLKDDDVIVMVTDGVLEVSDSQIDKEQWLCRCLLQMRHVNPEEIASQILAEAKKRSLEEIKDDMTVLVARVWEKV